VGDLTCEILQAFPGRSFSQVILPEISPEKSSYYSVQLMHLGTERDFAFFS
jgi:hypothetical protein